jgi:hypothetical protein
MAQVSRAKPRESVLAVNSVGRHVPALLWGLAICSCYVCSIMVG